MQSAPRLHTVYFLKLFELSGSSLENLVCFYTSVVRPILEYACPVWHSSLTVAQADALESIQKREMRLLCQADYTMACMIVGIENLHSRREHLTLSFFNRNVLNTESDLHYLLLVTRDPDIINRLRKPKQYQSVHSRTVKFSKSFIPHCLSNYQWLWNFVKLFSVF